MVLVQYVDRLAVAPVCGSTSYGSGTVCGSTSCGSGMWID